MKKPIVLLTFIVLGFGYAQICDDGFRQVTHELLDAPTCVPENPERVAVQHLTAFELMLMLGMEPVARLDDGFLSGYYRADPEIFARVQSLVGEVPVFGGLEMNLEVLTAAQPDLIIVFKDTQNLEQLSAIAPVVEAPVHAYQPGDWTALSGFFAEVLGVSDKYDALLADYRARMQVYRDLSTRFEGMSLVYTQFQGDGSIYLGLPGLYSWETLRDAGFVPVASLPTTPEAALERYGALVTQLSEERIQSIDADVIVAINGTVRADEQETVTGLIERVQNDPLWGTLQAVRNGRFYPKSLLWQSNGFVSAHAVIDDLLNEFAGVDASSVAPNPFLNPND